MSVPENIHREHILKAIEKIDAEGIPANAHSSTYDVVFNENRYPPKLVVSWANIFVNGQELDRNSFEGGINTPCFELLEREGFTIEKKIKTDLQSDHLMKTIFEKILAGWVKATQESFTGHPIASVFKNELKVAIENQLELLDVDYVVKASIGAGNWASVPWVSMLDPTITNSTQEGVYPVYLFREDGSGFYLSLGFGTTELKRKYGGSGAKEHAKYIAERIREVVPEIKEWGNDSIDLRSNTGLGKSYEWASAGAIFYAANDVPNDEILIRDLKRLIGIYRSIPKSFLTTFDKDLPSTQSTVNIERVSLPKPFLLLAGISGTGKTRFVREQANANRSNYAIVAVRPDWHEPSDLLGYVSRIGNHGAEYVVTDVLRFMVKAWQAAFAAFDGSSVGLKPLEQIEPYWLCLDEMNLAPVEQYFADYLSVLETREWKNGQYDCEPLLKIDALKEILKADGLERLRGHLGLEGDAGQPLWDFFLANGIPLPPNLIVAGTVNMDETTHGFSRKVIDRAFTIDFGEFFPNNYDHYLNPENAPQPVKFGFPILSSVTPGDLQSVAADSDGKKSVAFLESVNKVLKGTPFELAYRALNELLLAVVCFSPKDEDELKAVWDDFLMTKVLPRIEGDAEKLRINNRQEGSVLEELENLLKGLLPGNRPDLFRTNTQGDEPLMIPARSLAKLEWMRARLENNSFTAFWP